MALMTTRWRKVLLAAATLFAMLSYGGLLVFVFLPLAFGFWWAVRRSHGFERAAWVGLFALAAGEWAWQVTYPVTEGDSPSSWIIALISGSIAAGLLAGAADYTLSRNVGS